MPDTSLVFVALPAAASADQCVAACAEPVLAAVKLEFDVSEASALFPKAHPRNWKVMLKPISPFPLRSGTWPWLGGGKHSQTVIYLGL